MSTKIKLWDCGSSVGINDVKRQIEKFFDKELCNVPVKDIKTIEAGFDNGNGTACYLTGVIYEK